MARPTTIQRLRALVGRIITPTEGAVAAGRVPLTRIWAATDAREVIVRDGSRPISLLVGWPIDLTHRGWSHPALEGYLGVLDKTVLLSAVPRPGREPVVIPRAHLDYEKATLTRVSVIEMEGPRLVFEDRASAVLLAHNIYPRSDLMAELFRIAQESIGGDRPASTVGGLIRGGTWGGV